MNTFDHQTDDGLYCSTLMRILEPVEVRGHELLHTDPSRVAIAERDIQTAKDSLAEGESTALPGVVPVGVAAQTIPEQRSRMQALQAALPPGAFRTDDHRYYWNGKGPVPSVTTILNDVLNKPALITWKSQEVARAIYRDSKSFFGEKWEMGEEAAIKWALAQADKQRDDAAKVGTSVHLLADMQARMPSGAPESDSKGFEVSEQEKPYLEAFRAFQGFLEARGARIVSSEHMVWSDLGYAGTYDLIVEMPIWEEHQAAPESINELWMIDIKTSKGVYPEYALQLIGYGKADRIILEGNPESYPMPHIDRYAVLHLRPDQYKDTGYRLYEYPVTDDDFYRFTSVLDLYLWRKEDKYRKSQLITVT